MKGRDPLAPFYRVAVEYAAKGKKAKEASGLKLVDYVSMNELPVDLKYMVYFIRRFLKVELTNDRQEIATASFTTQEKVVFTDKTRVGRTTWKQLKHEAMGPEAQKQNYFKQFSDMDRLLVKNLIAA
jgi:hypothetical protein